ADREFEDECTSEYRSQDCLHLLFDPCHRYGAICFAVSRKPKGLPMVAQALSLKFSPICRTCPDLTANTSLWLLEEPLTSCTRAIDTCSLRLSSWETRF